MDNDYGFYGVLRFLKKDDDKTVVASYPIDDEELTFGKAPECNIRLYYPTVSQTHAKIIFQDRKAFLIILGPHGLLVDNSPIFPSPSSGQTTVPLTNNNILEINKKRFRFQYPPKPIRAALAAQINTPTASPSTRSRTLRLSMIQSTQVFSPKPDPDPRVNLRILKTPIRASPLKRGHNELDDEEPPIVLVDGNHPRVVEEGKDLVILEDIARSNAAASRQPQHSPTKQLVPRQQQQFSTPARRPPRNSLHRAVLIRSAQRAAQREVKKQEEEDMELEAVEMIVEESVSALDREGEDLPQDAPSDGDVFDDEATDEEEEVEEEERGRAGMSTWRRGVDVVKSGWRSFSRSVSPEKEASLLAKENGSDENKPKPKVHEEEMWTEDARTKEEPSTSVHIPNPASVFRSSVPQRPPPDQASPMRTSQSARLSVSLADRVRATGRLSTSRGTIGAWSTQEPWKVSEIEVQRRRSPERTAIEPSPRISNAEREAIQERRRSALFGPDSFWGQTGVPGSRTGSPVKSPFKTSLAPSNSEPSRLPAPDFGLHSPERAKAIPASQSYDAVMSPAKTWAASRASGSQSTVEEGTDEEPDIMLDRIKTTIEGMKRRRSMRAEEEERRKSMATVHNEPSEGEEHTERGQEVLEPTRRTQPATPLMDDLRHVFTAPQRTPRVSGIQDIFAAEEPIETILSGKNKAGPSARYPDEVSANDENLVHVSSEASSGRKSSAESAPKRASDPSREALTKKAASSEDGSALIKPATVARAAPRAKLPVRPGRVTPTDAGADEDNEVEVEAPVPRARTRTMTAPKAGSSKGAKAGPSNTTTELLTKSTAKAKATAQPRRTRKPADIEDEAPAAVKPAPAKKPAVRSAKPASSTTRTPAASRRKNPTTDDERDPLAMSSGDEDAPVASRVRRRHAADDADDDDSSQATRTRKTPVRAATRKATTAATTTAIRKTSGRKAAMAVAETGGKENTPDSARDEDDTAPSGATRSAATATAATTRSGARRTAVRKEQAGQSEPETGTQAKTRATRARAVTKG